MTRRRIPRSLALLALVSALLSGCASPSASSGTETVPTTDEEYLTADLWNDGQAEVAFYRVERTRDQYGNANPQQFLVGTYLVKHLFSPAEMTKMTDGTGTSSFKYALFYELESGSYQYKRNWVVNARQRDLRPFKQSFSSFDWCSNQYRELAFPPNEQIELRMRSDDYGNRRTSFDAHANSYPPAELPLLVRGLDFSETDTLAFSVVVGDDTKHVPAKATFVGTDSVQTEAGRKAAERIRVTYDEPVPSLIGEESDSTETYWRGTGPGRLLLRIESASGRYQMSLVEHLRTPYWTENLWEKVERVQERP